MNMKNITTIALLSVALCGAPSFGMLRRFALPVGMAAVAVAAKTSYAAPDANEDVARLTKLAQAFRSRDTEKLKEARETGRERVRNQKQPYEDIYFAVANGIVNKVVLCEKERRSVLMDLVFSTKRGMQQWTHIGGKPVPSDPENVHLGRPIAVYYECMRCAEKEGALTEDRLRYFNSVKNYLEEHKIANSELMGEYIHGIITENWVDDRDWKGAEKEISKVKTVLEKLNKQNDGFLKSLIEKQAPVCEKRWYETIEKPLEKKLTEGAYSKEVTSKIADLIDTGVWGCEKQGAEVVAKGKNYNTLSKYWTNYNAQALEEYVQCMKKVPRIKDDIDGYFKHEGQAATAYFESAVDRVAQSLTREEVGAFFSERGPGHGPRRFMRDIAEERVFSIDRKK